VIGSALTSLRLKVRSAAPWSVWLLLAVLLVGMYAGSLWVRAQYVPDSRYYAAMAFHFGGESQESARSLVAEQDAKAGWETPPLDRLFDWGLVQPRIIYPLLSAPFAAVLGINGMLVVPAAATLALALVMFLVCSWRYGWPAAAAGVVLVVTSSYLMWFSTAMLTEGLAAAWVAALVLTLPLSGPRSWKVLLACALLLVAVAFTRQVTLIPVAAIVSAWFFASWRQRRVRNDWAAFALVSVVVLVATQIVQSVLWGDVSPSAQFLKATGTTSLGDAFAAAPGLAGKIVSTDVRAFMFYDRSLAVLLTLCVVSAVWRWRQVESHLVIGAMAAGFILNLVNGVPTSFRYSMPGVAFVVLAVSALAADVLALGRSAVGDEPEPS